MSKLSQRAWFNIGKKENKGTFMLIIYDALNSNDYPLFVEEPELNEQIKLTIRAPMQRILEVYDLREDREEQLQEPRTWRVPTNGQTSS